MRIPPECGERAPRHQHAGNGRHHGALAAHGGAPGAGGGLWLTDKGALATLRPSTWARCMTSPSPAARSPCRLITKVELVGKARAAARAPGGQDLRGPRPGRTHAGGAGTGGPAARGHPPRVAATARRRVRVHRRPADAGRDPPGAGAGLPLAGAGGPAHAGGLHPLLRRTPGPGLPAPCHRSRHSHAPRARNDLHRQGRRRHGPRPAGDPAHRAAEARERPVPVASLRWVSSWGAPCWSTATRRGCLR